MISKLEQLTLPQVSNYTQSTAKYEVFYKRSIAGIRSLRKMSQTSPSFLTSSYSIRMLQLSEVVRTFLNCPELSRGSCFFLELSRAFQDMPEYQSKGARGTPEKRGKFIEIAADEHFNERVSELFKDFPADWRSHWKVSGVWWVSGSRLQRERYIRDDNRRKLSGSLVSYWTLLVSIQQGKRVLILLISREN